MATLSAHVTQGVLTGTGVDVIATAGATSAQETWSVVFRNYSSDAWPLVLYVNGTDAAQVIYKTTLEADESVIATLSVGANDDLRAETIVANSISWTLTRGVLT